MSDWLTGSLPLVLGHRGAKAFAPENTMAAFHLALEQGADGFEFDIQLSKDGVPMVIHDATLDRTTDGTGRVDQYTAAELSDFDAGEGEKIPTLETLLAEFRQNVLYNIEIKAYRFWPNGVESAVGALIEKYAVAQQTVVSSFNFINMHRFRDLGLAEVGMAMIRYPGPQALSDKLFSAEIDHPYFAMVTPDYMAWAKKEGKRVNCWTVNETAEALRLAQLGVHGIISDRPGEIRQAIFDNK